MTVPDRTDRERGVAEAGASLPRPAPRGRRGARLAVAVTFLLPSRCICRNHTSSRSAGRSSSSSASGRFMCACAPDARPPPPLRRSSSRSCSPSRSACRSCSSSSRSAARGRPSCNGSRRRRRMGYRFRPGRRFAAPRRAHRRLVAEPPLAGPHGTADLIGEINVDTVISATFAYPRRRGPVADFARAPHLHCGVRAFARRRPHCEPGPRPRRDMARRARRAPGADDGPRRPPDRERHAPRRHRRGRRHRRRLCPRRCARTPPCSRS